ncbi:ABC transporter ATP-binding protein [Paenisporosarcina sp. TG20]|uniref:ABC transporter ATP-binding protein n=1 Tax=Paenisporosarcina sp. TG20 TaxID=1211706 RepID=UPI0002F3C3FA|nr:ABC transporter ATP-binding protein [Paenisporosarcina sp. TG20]
MEIFKKLKEYYWPNKHLFFWSLFMLLITLLVTVAYPVILQQTIDRVIKDGQYDLAWTLAGIFIALMIVKGFATYIGQYTGDMFGIRSVYELRNGLYGKLQRLPFSYYDNAKTGDLMSRLTADVEGFRFFLSFGFVELFRLVFLVSVSLCIMFYYSVSLTFVTMATMPLLVVAVFRFDKLVHPAFRDIRKSFGKLNTNVQENISGIQTVKSLSRESFQINKFNNSNSDYKDRYIYTAEIWAKYFPVMELLGNLSIVLLFGYGGFQVMNGQLTVGELVAFYSLLGYIIFPIMNLGFTVNLFSQSKASGERLLEILEAPEPITSKVNAQDGSDIKGHVAFEHVTLKYQEDDQVALNDVNLTVEAGKRIGLLGSTGSGKTSLTQLLTRFYEPTKGTVKIDGINVNDYTLTSLRSNIGFVLQESFLFSSSIKANISYGRPDAAMEDIINAAKRANAHDFILEQPNGYDTMLGERGLGLSGGQKQRIAIARALCQNPAILVLDDATSAVDMKTELHIQQGLEEVMKGRTTFIIAHRISSVKHADELIIFEHGKIVQRGTHEELIQQQGLYKRIYEIQYKDQLEETYA